MDFLNDPLKVAADLLEGLFTAWGMNAVFAHVLVAFLGILLLLSILMVLDIFLVWLERKVVSRFQDRIGPNHHKLHRQVGFERGSRLSSSRRADHPFNDLPQIDPVFPQVQRAGIDPRDCEEIAYHHIEAFGLGFDLR